MKNLKIFVVFPLILFSFGKLNSQVTIGSSTPPNEMSLLYLDTSIAPRALHLPRLSMTERDALISSDDEKVLARGLMIFNTDTKCLEFWNGREWISLCVDVLDEPEV